MFAECEYWRLFHNFSVSEYAMIYWNRLILRADDSKEHTFESVDGWMHFYNGIATVKMAWLLSSYSSTKNWHSINFMNQKLQPFYTRPFKFRWLNSYMVWKSVEICPIRHLIYINDDQNSEELKFWQETNSHCCLKMSIKECFKEKSANHLKYEWSKTVGKTVSSYACPANHSEIQQFLWKYKLYCWFEGHDWWLIQGIIAIAISHSQTNGNPVVSTSIQRKQGYYFEIVLHKKD